MSRKGTRPVKLELLPRMGRERANHNREIKCFERLQNKTINLVEYMCSSRIEISIKLPPYVQETSYFVVPQMELEMLEGWKSEFQEIMKGRYRTH